MRTIDLTGKLFGRLTVVQRSQNVGECVAWLCKCKCGNYHVVTGANLRQGNVKSCGCLRIEAAYVKRLKHGMSNTPIHNTWKQMKGRCYNTNDDAYDDYGGRGITVCDRWRNVFEAFDEDVSKLPHYGEDGYTLDRIDVNGNYEPENVRWSDSETQANNRRNNRLLTYNGKTQTEAQWAKELCINVTTLNMRLNKYHWSIEKALTEPVKK